MEAGESQKKVVVQSVYGIPTLLPDSLEVAWP